MSHTVLHITILRWINYRKLLFFGLQPVAYELHVAHAVTLAILPLLFWNTKPSIYCRNESDYHRVPWHFSMHVWRNNIFFVQLIFPLICPWTFMIICKYQSKETMVINSKKIVIIFMYMYLSDCFTLNPKTFYIEENYSELVSNSPN